MSGNGGGMDLGALFTAGMRFGQTFGEMAGRFLDTLDALAATVERAVDLYEIEVEGSLPGAFMPGEKYPTKWEELEEEGGAG